MVFHVSLAQHTHSEVILGGRGRLRSFKVVFHGSLAQNTHSEVVRHVIIEKFCRIKIADFSSSITFSLSVPRLSVCFQGYLFLASEEGATLMEEAHRLQRQEGAQVALYSKDKLKNDFPWLNTEGLVLGSFGLENEGWFDPTSLLNGFRQKASSTNTQFIKGIYVCVRMCSVYVFVCLWLSTCILFLHVCAVSVCVPSCDLCVSVCVCVSDCFE